MAIDQTSPFWADYQNALANGNHALANQYQTIAGNAANTPDQTTYRNNLIQNQMLANGGSGASLSPDQIKTYNGMVTSGVGGNVPNGVDPNGVFMTPSEAGAALSSNTYNTTGQTGHVWDQPLSQGMQGLLGGVKTVRPETTPYGAAYPATASVGQPAANSAASPQYVPTFPTANSTTTPVYAAPSPSGQAPGNQFGGQVINVPGASGGNNIVFGKPEHAIPGQPADNSFYSGVQTGLQDTGLQYAIRQSPGGQSTSAITPSATAVTGGVKSEKIGQPNVEQSIAPAVATPPQLGAAATAGTASASGSHDVNAAQAGLTTWGVDPSKQTVQGQLNGLLSQGSPLMTIAKTKAEQAMNGKGLLNSSMAVQAGQQAVIDSAMPIATQDASTYAQNGQYNATSANNNSQFNATQSNQIGMNNQAETNKVNQFNAGQANTVGMSNVDQMNRFGLANLDAATKTMLANLTASTQLGVAQTEANYKTNQQLQSSVAALQMSYVTQRGMIANNQNMDAASKAAAYADLDKYYQQQANLLGVIASGNSSYVMIGV